MKTTILAVALFTMSACGNSAPAAGPAGAAPEAGVPDAAPAVPAKPVDAGALTPDKK